MAITAAEIKKLLESGLPDATVTITDLAGDGEHYKARVVSPSFRGKSKVRQHQMVYAALGDVMGGALHALMLETLSSDGDVSDSGGGDSGGGGGGGDGGD